MRNDECAADLYEVYWAPKAHHKTSARSVLAWILALTFRSSVRGQPASKSARLKNYYDIAFMSVSIVLIGAFLSIMFVSLGTIAVGARCLEEPGEDCPELVNDLDLQNDDVWAPERTGQVGTILRRAIFTGDNYGARRLADLNLSDTTSLLTNVRAWQTVVLAAIAWVALQVAFRSGVQALKTIGGPQKIVALAYLPVQVSIAWWIGDATGGRFGGTYVAAILSITLLGLVYPVIFRRFLKEPIGISAGDDVDHGVGGRAEAPILALIVLLLLTPLVPALLVAFVLVLVVAYVVVRSLSDFLAESIGDIQVYTTHDPNSEHFSVRESILSEAQEVFSEIAKKDYDSIVIIGHSLGSVIAFDVLPELQRREPDVFRKVAVMITLGGPLEKVRRFFTPTKSRLRQAAKTQLRSIVDDRWERKTDLALAARLITEPDEVRGIPGRPWLNLWYANDPVANPITSFGPSKQIHLGRFAWGPLKPDPDLVDAQTMLTWCTENQGVLNIGFGWRWKGRLFWPHSDYLIAEDILTLIRDVAFGPLPRPQLSPEAGQKEVDVVET